MEQETKKAAEAKDAAELKAIAGDNRRMIEAEKAEADPKAKGKICPKCGAENVGRATCSKCHAPLYSDRKDPKPARSVKTQKLSKKDLKAPDKKKKAVAKEKAEGKKGGRFEKKDPSTTKYGRLRILLTSGKRSFSLSDLMKASGFDERNTRTALSILMNSKKTKKENMIRTSYDKEKKLVTLE